MTRTATVLAGGGTKGDFEVGVFHYLYSTGIRPDVLCTISNATSDGLHAIYTPSAPHRHMCGGALYPWGISIARVRQ
jgi:hypothetical protein